MGVGGLSESAIKGKFVTKIFFQKILNVLISCKHGTADVKADVKQEKIKELLTESCIY